MKSIHLIVSGKVQGVFFRANVKDKATELELVGYSKNLADGNVEIVAQGNEEKINKLIKFIKNNPGHSKVREMKINHKEIKNFKSFEIRY